MFPSECLLERVVRVYADEDLGATNLPLFILKCKDRKAEGYAANKLEIHNQSLKDMVIGVRLADAPPAVSYLVILRSEFLSPDIIVVAVSKTVIVIRLLVPGEVGLSYLIYDAVALSLRLIPAPRDPSWAYVPCSAVSVARPCGGPDYALVHTGLLLAAGEYSLFLWRPSSLQLPPPPWSEHKKASLKFEWGANSINTEFTFNGHAYWVDLLCGVFYCSCDALFDDNISVVKFRRFIPLPVPPAPSDDDHRIACPDAYRTIGVVSDCFVRFVSIDGFQDYVKLKKRTVTVWKLLGHKWKQEYKISLETLWGFEGFGPVRKDLTPMYPHLSTQDMDVIYLALGEYREDRFDKDFYPFNPCYLLAIDMRNKIVLSSVPLDEENWYSAFISWGFTRYLRKALVGPCDNKGIPMKKKRRPPSP